MPDPASGLSTLYRRWNTRLLAFLQDQEAWLAGLFLVFAVAFNLYNLYTEAVIHIPALNDNNLHFVAFQRTVGALAAGQDPLDHWLGTITEGYPLFHYYQNIPHVTLALLYLPFQQLISSQAFYDWARYLLLCLFPLSIYLSMRWLGFSPLPAALAGLAAPMLAAQGLYGLDYSSYVWRGYGMVTQLWGMLLLPLALGSGYRALRDGRSYALAALLLALTMLSHLVYGYMAVLALLLVALVGGAGPGSAGFASRFGRLLLVFLLVGALTAYFVVPYWLDRAYMNRSVWEYIGKYDSYGYEWVVPALLKGQLFDTGRLPVFTLLVGIGLAICAWTWRRPQSRLLLALFIFWVCLYFGRPTWGVLLDLLPLSQEMHFHRLIGGVHLAGIYLAGVALAMPWQIALKRRQKPALLALALLVTALFFLPLVRERSAYLADNTSMMLNNQAALLQEDQDLGALLDVLHKLPPGRVYAGLPATWGSQYKVGDLPVYALLNWAGLDTVGYLYHALSLNADVQVLFNENRYDHFNLFNVRYLVAPADRSFPDFVKPIGTFGRHRLYQVDTSGYFDLVSSDLTFSGNKTEFYPAASAWLATSLPANHQHPTVDLSGRLAIGNGVLPLAQAPAVLQRSFTIEPPPPGRIVQENISPGEYRAQVELPQDSLVMVKTTYHPNLRLSVDGAPAEPVMLMPSYVGVHVPAGSHQVAAVYRSQPWKWLLLALGLLLLAVAFAIERRPEAQSVAAVRRRLDRWTRQAGGLGRWLWQNDRLVAWRVRLAPHLPYLELLALAALLSARTVLQPRILMGHDALEYLMRSQLFYHELQTGNFFPRWTAYLNVGYGEPFFNFNPPFIYYLISAWHSLGSGFLLAQNLAAFTVICLAGLGMYILVAEFFGRPAGLAAATAYLFAPYFLVNLYVRQALADFSAFAWLPFAFWGLYHYSRRGQLGFLLVGSVSLALLLLSSNPLALATFPFLLLWLGWIALHERDGRAFGRGLLTLGLGLGLSAYFWIPALGESGLVHLERLKQGYLSYANHFVYPLQLLYSSWGYGLSAPGVQDEMSFAIGPLYLLACVVVLFSLGRIRRRSPAAGQWAAFALLLTAGAVFFASQPSVFVWDRLPLLQIMEFPWRFLSLVAFGTSILIGATFALLPAGQKRLEHLLLAAWLVGLLLSGLPDARPQGYQAAKAADYTPQQIATSAITATTVGEYQPVWVQELPSHPSDQPLSLISGEASLVSTHPSSTYLEAHVKVSAAARLRASSLYFPGWSLYVNGMTRDIQYDNPQGVIEFDLEPGEHLVQLIFQDTPVRRWSKAISLAALAALTFVLLRALIRQSNP